MSLVLIFAVLSIRSAGAIETTYRHIDMPDLVAYTKFHVVPACCLKMRTKLRLYEASGVLRTLILADDLALAAVVGDTVPVPEVCKPLLKVNQTYSLSAAAFRNTLVECSSTPKHERENLTDAAKALVDVYEAISKNTCSFEHSGEIEDKLVQCVKGNGLNKFSKEEAKSHFSMNGTVDLIFETQQCKTAGKIWDCVNGLFSKKKCSRELKGCKDNIFAGFEAAKAWCDMNSLDEVSSGHSDLPAYTLILGSAFVLVKSGIFP